MFHSSRFRNNGKCLDFYFWMNYFIQLKACVKHRFITSSQVFFFFFFFKSECITRLNGAVSISVSSGSFSWNTVKPMNSEFALRMCLDLCYETQKKKEGSQTVCMSSFSFPVFSFVDSCPLTATGFPIFKSENKT